MAVDEAPVVAGNPSVHQEIWPPASAIRSVIEENWGQFDFIQGFTFLTGPVLAPVITAKTEGSSPIPEAVVDGNFDRSTFERMTSALTL